ncbi:MAG: FliA/WhiG family RNA polymerase sigma factor [Deltaproteobacteria bacterium]|nr:FliA/WhiG family RNA polymerase sigma factor [Deltaproteobacteria bacterium]
MAKVEAGNFVLEEEVLLKEYLPLIQRLAYRLVSRLPGSVEVDDLINSGVLGLLDAVGKFEPERNIQFKTYAEFRIRGAMMDDLRSQDWASRGLRKDCNLLESAYAEVEHKLGRPAEDAEVAGLLDLSLEEFYKLLARARGISLVNFEDLADSDSDAPRSPLEMIALIESDDPFVLCQDREMQELLAEAIDDLKERDRVVLQLYYYEELNLKEIGLVLEVSESRVCQMRTQAIVRLRSKIKTLRRKKISVKV